jgi:hypothetical protein
LLALDDHPPGEEWICLTTTPFKRTLLEAYAWANQYVNLCANTGAEQIP